MIESKIVSAVVYVVGGAIALFLAYLNGKRAERIRQLQNKIEETAKEQEVKNEIDSTVANMPIDSVRERLQNTKSK